MKKTTLRMLFLFFMAAAIVNGCNDETDPDDESENPDGDPDDEKEGTYEVAVELINTAENSTWRYTITRKDGAKDPGYFIVDFGNCQDESASIENVISAKVNGTDWSSNISDTDSKMDCEVTATNFVKFDKLTKADQHVIEFTLDTLYAQASATAWLKGNKECKTYPVTGPGCRGYILTATMNADASLTGKDHNEINTYMKTFGFDYSEHPNCSGGYGGHADGVHTSIAQDNVFNKPVFQFDIHIDPVIDGDRCSGTVVDRQRNEMKSITNNTTWAKVQGNYDEWQVLEWKFKLPVGFQPTNNFCHIHQLKAQDGPNNSNPIITLTPRANADGSNKRLQIIHTIDGVTTDKGTMVNNVPLSELEGEWVQVREVMHYTHTGYYACKITRISDGKVILDFEDTNIDLWPGGASYIRHKYGLYRSLGNGRVNLDPVGQNPLLKNESLWITDFKVYEGNTNPTPGEAHD